MVEVSDIIDRGDVNGYIAILEVGLTQVAEDVLCWANNPKVTIHNVSFANVDGQVHWVDFEIAVTWDNDFKIIELSIPLKYEYLANFICGAFYSKLISEEERRDEILNE